MRSLLRVLAASVALAGATSAQAPVPKPLEAPTAADLASGAKVFVKYCGRCHGFDGSGGVGPPLTRPRLRRAADESGILEILVNGIPGTSMQAAWSLSERETLEVAAYVTSLGRRAEEPLPGDPARGRDLYARHGCAACHVVDGEGTSVGPDLSDIGLKRGAAFLRQSLLDPAAARPERAVPYEPYGYPAYEVVRARTRAGAEIEGVRLNEDAFTLQLRDRAGNLHSLRKLELTVLGSDPAESVMPSYRAVLGGRDLDDLAAWLMTRRTER
jgi:putative heme-binding domain-containing protein